MNAELIYLTSKTNNSMHNINQFVEILHQIDAKLNFISPSTPANLEQIIDIAVKRSDVILINVDLQAISYHLALSLIAKSLNISLTIQEKVYNSLSDISIIAAVFQSKSNESSIGILFKNKKVLITHGKSLSSTNSHFLKWINLNNTTSNHIITQGLRIFPISQQQISNLIERLQNKYSSIIIDSTYDINEATLKIQSNMDHSQSLFKSIENDISNYFLYKKLYIGTIPLELDVSIRLQNAQKTLSIAESCTGGLISKIITSISGCSTYFNGAICTYTNQSKINLLGVPKHIIDTHGAVSKETAIAMAIGVQKAFKTDYALSTTGVAGPNGTPVGLVYIALVYQNTVECVHINMNTHKLTNRTEIQMYTAKSALLLLINHLKK